MFSCVKIKSKSYWIGLGFPKEHSTNASQLLIDFNSTWNESLRGKLEKDDKVTKGSFLFHKTVTDRGTRKN